MFCEKSRAYWKPPSASQPNGQPRPVRAHGREQAEIREAVAKAGFEALELGGENEDAEAKARQHEIRTQRHLLITGLIFTVPLFVFSMGMDFGLLPMAWMKSTWAMLLMLALATPVQFYVGWQYYVGAV